MKESQDKSARIIFFVIFAVISITIGWIIGYQQGNQSSSDESQTTSSESSEEIAEEITLLIGESDDEFHIDYVEGESAFDVVQRLDQENDSFAFTFDEFDFGVFITEINGVIADDTKEFWSFEVNGETSEVGISDYVVQPEDTLSFKIEAFN